MTTAFQEMLPPFPAPEPGLYIVSVPIGNLRDITLRALETLRGVDMIFCEDTRSAASLCKKYGIHPKKLMSYHDHSDAERRDGLLSHIYAGASAALVSDAGTPMIADPGFKLVRAAAETGVKVIPVPGVCAATAALTVSGLPSDKFIFEGFLPQKKAARKTALKESLQQRGTLIFYEAPHRLQECLQDIASLHPERSVCVARELTKRYEEIARGTAATVAALFQARDAVKGECVVLVGGKPDGAEVSETDESVRTRLAELLKTQKTKDAAAVLADETGLPVKTLYRMALAIKADKKHG